MGAEARQSVDRRSVIAAAVGLAAVGAVAGTVAGCGASTGGTGTAAPEAPASPAPLGPPSVGVPTGTGTPLGPAADVPVGGGKVYENLEVVVTQPEAGRYEGLSAVCTHTGCIVDKVADGLIECPCHGSRYHLDGSVANGPAPRALTARPVTVVNGSVVLS